MRIIQLTIYSAYLGSWQFLLHLRVLSTVQLLIELPLDGFSKASITLAKQW